MRITDLLREGTKILNENNINSAALDSRIILSYITSYNTETLLLKSNEEISSELTTKFFKLIKRRQYNEPIAYIIGKKEFYDIDFIVDKNVLIPRPDSETLIELALSYLQTQAAGSILDLGTGSGCLILTLLSAIPHTTGVGVDISEGAIQIARKNAELLNLVKRAKFLKSNWSDLKLENKFDLIISNPPYIESKDIVTLQKDVKNYEPITALDGGKDGLDCYRKIFEIAGNFLKEDGICIVEIGAGQFSEVTKIASYYNFKLQEFRKDLLGKIRSLSFNLIA
ncbi:MAG: peptide chain release factor N(5)-glutamine methyltransferase [Rickettsiales bacterium]|nr:peptide chain release factor N(5)-glutamine methyltransferase [Rickettsiales bacterium]